ncbi:MAG: type I-E CRISPR-associated protein Cse1/CasA [Phycisphaerales bacterium]|nr:type I-E CRISPR-associated protein Cse1/CasA [Phycisphaerales bacterium]
MSPTDPSATFNLIEARWIPVLRTNGQFERVGIRMALMEAGSIRQIAASNPMDNVSLLRFLLAVLLWCRPGLDEAERRGLDGATRIPEGWLKKLVGQQPEPAFNLLGDGVRFYQDSSLKGKEPRPIADLLGEFPGADSVNHMRHVVHDGSYGFCPACCALGILRLSVWAPANRFYPASVNPSSAAYAVVEGKDLLTTMIVNLPHDATHSGEAPWLTDQPPDPQGAIACLAWRPRRLWLNVADGRGACANCGQPGVLVESLCNDGGWPTPKTEGRLKKFWELDPHLLIDGEPASLPGLGASAAVHASRFWRDAVRLSAGLKGRVVAVGPVVNKFVFQDAARVVFPRLRAQSRVEFSQKVNEKLRGVLRKATPNADRQHPQMHAAVTMLTPDAEARVFAVLQAPDPGADEGLLLLHNVYGPLVERVVSSTARGSPLRRREAVSRALAALDRVLRTAAARPAGQKKSAPNAAKPNRSRRKKGAAS